MNCLAFRRSLACVLLAFSASASALGLGELRGRSPSLGESLRLEVELLGDIRSLDASCFRLGRPADDDELPWLKKAAFSLRRGVPAILEIRSDAPLREPILQLAVRVGCGLEISREYTVLAMPARSVQGVNPAAKDVAPDEALSAPVAESRPAAERPRARRAMPPPPPPVLEPLVRPQPRKPETRRLPSGLPDRLLLSGGDDAAEPSLRLATDLSAVGEAKEPQRELLRLEFRMLLALTEQTTTQLATAEKLRNMEAALGELQQRATEFTQRVEQQVQPAPAEAPKSEPGLLPKTAPVAPPMPTTESPALSEWSLYGGVLGVVLGLVGWLGWRTYRERRRQQDDSVLPFVASEPQVDPQRDDESDEPLGVDLTVEPMVHDRSMAVDFELDAAHSVAPPPIMPQEKLADSVFSIGATTLDEHFEANPVMELADIMLSFGRVKGAAQALQEYIDNNPQEALQPWIRLMDVYRMAGMRNEFEAVARNLNQNFNVEIQNWDPAQPEPNRHTMDLLLDETVEAAGEMPAMHKAMALEEMPRLMGRISELWATGDVVGYMYQLLRDNRGGKRIGFSLPVVEEVLFLIELKETANRMGKESAVR